VLAKPISLKKLDWGSAKVLKERINNDLKAAMISGNRFLANVLRGLKAVILNAEVEEGKRESGLEDIVIERLIAKEVKKRYESADIYKSSERLDLAEDEIKEAEYIAQYLPAQVSEDDIRQAVKASIEELGAVDTKMLGKVITSVKDRFGTSADNAKIASIAKELLNN
jgi:uncharacterized protein